MVEKAYVTFRRTFGSIENRLSSKNNRKKYIKKLLQTQMLPRLTCLADELGIVNILYYEYLTLFNYLIRLFIR